MSKSGSLWPIVLGIWLILEGIMPLLHLGFRGSGTVLAVLAVIAGVLVILDR